MNRTQAIKSGNKTYIGKVCKCGCSEKYVSSYGCVACTLARNDSSYIKEYSKSSKSKERSKKYTEKIKSEGKISEYNRKYRENGGSKKSKKYYDTNKDVWRNSQLKRTYGIKLDEYNKMLKQQENRCSICGEHKDLFRKFLAVDHDHKTGAIRGLLCKNCNTGLGNFKDSVEIMNKAIAYLGSN